MSASGGEILRAVMEASCVYSNPAFYCIPMDAGAVTNAVLRGLLQLHKDRWFLLTNIIPTATEFSAVATDVGYQRLARPEFVRLYDPATNEDFARVANQMHASELGDTSFNYQFTLPEYIAWEPASLIGVEWQGIGSATANIKFLTLAGIEYGMKD